MNKLLLALSSTAAVIFYLGAAIAQVYGLAGKFDRSKKTLLWLGMAAIMIHALLLYHWIDVGYGQNLALMNMLSFTAWLISLLLLLFIWRYPAENLCVLIFPLAALTIILIELFPTTLIIQTAGNPKQLIHLFSSALTVSVLFIAGLQAVLLALQEYGLRRKPSSRFMQKLPPLQTAEALLFYIIGWGFLLLSIVIATSLLFFYQVMTAQLFHKTVLAVIVWLLFAILLSGRYWFGWRGRRAIYITLSAVILLIIIYQQFPLKSSENGFPVIMRRMN